MTQNLSHEYLSLGKVEFNIRNPENFQIKNSKTVHFVLYPKVDGVKARLRHFPNCVGRLTSISGYKPSGRKLKMQTQQGHLVWPLTSSH